MTSPARRLLAVLDRLSYDVYAGVPCSLAKAFLEILERERAARWVPAVREDVAVGVAAGASLAGRKAVVVMQNSGLGVCLNALASLNAIYRIPALLLVTWRGEGGADAPEHVVMGEITEPILDLARVPSLVLEADRLEEQVLEADGIAMRSQCPVALLVRKGVLS